jgi:hypothetical protein
MLFYSTVQKNYQNGGTIYKGKLNTAVGHKLVEKSIGLQ